MRSWFAAVLTLSLVWSTSAWAQAAYGDDEVEDEGQAYGAPETEPTPPPPPAAAAAPSAPAEALPPAPEDQQQWKYNGPHAVNAEYGTGFCNLQGVHYHPYPPFDDHLFQEQDGGYNFLGDPADFGYAGDDLSWYNAAHPIAIGFGIGWCFMSWPHRHFYRPWGPYFTGCGPYYCYSGPFDAYYWRWRPYWAPYFSAYYPRFYRGGLYARYRTPASPGRWAHVGPRHGGAVGRPGGYARPVPGHLGGLQGRGTPYARPHTTGPIHAGPRMAPRAAPTPRFSAPRTHGAPRSLAAPKMHGPRFSAPKFGGGGKSFGRALSRPSFSFGKKH
jgi:hypothetical protein